MQLLTNSRLRTYRECERRHDLAYNRNIRPRKTSDALRFGTLMHLGIEAWWSSTGEERLEAALAAVDQESDPFERAKAAAMIVGYHERWKDDGEIETVAVEIPFETALLNPRTLAASRNWRLAGKLDGIVRRRGQTAIREFKTTAFAIDSDADDYWTKLAMDSQISIYVLGAESLGYAVAETLYDVARKPALRPLTATPVESRRYTKDGRLYASQRETDETPEEFAARVAAELAENPEKYYQRRWIPRDEAQMREFMWESWQSAKAIREGQLLKRSTRNPDACMRMGRCPYWSVCAYGEDPLTSPDFEVLETAHPELVTNGI
jgi:hypothetical protein